MSGNAPAAKGSLAVICTMSCKDALIDLLPEFERTSGWRVDATYGPGAGLAKKIREGLSGDVFVGPEEFSSGLIEDGRLRGESRRAFAHSGAALAVKAGAPRPDIHSADALKSALLAVRAVCYSTGASGIHFLQACERLGIRDAVEAKLVKPRPGEMVGPVLVRGEAEIGVQQPAELLPVAGIEILGPLPPELRQTIVYGATLLAGSPRGDGLAALLEFMRSPHAREVLRHTGLEPV